MAQEPPPPTLVTLLDEMQVPNPNSDAPELKPQFKFLVGPAETVVYVSRKLFTRKNSPVLAALINTLMREGIEQMARFPEEDLASFLACVEFLTTGGYTSASPIEGCALHNSSTWLEEPYGSSFTTAGGAMTPLTSTSLPKAKISHSNRTAPSPVRPLTTRILT
jgi:hypothetical protein